MGEAEMTERFKGDEQSPPHHAWHPLGRILLSRPAYPVNLEPVIEKAAEKGIIIEFNANPFRMDLQLALVPTGETTQGPIAINPDAHTVEELDLARLSIPVVQKGWLRKKRCF